MASTAASLISCATVVEVTGDKSTEDRPMNTPRVLVPEIAREDDDHPDFDESFQNPEQNGEHQQDMCFTPSRASSNTDSDWFHLDSPMSESEADMDNRSDFWNDDI
jgi:hypothetical protein